MGRVILTLPFWSLFMNDFLNNLEGFDSGSNYKFGDKMIKNYNPRSLFDLSHLSTMTIKNCGYVVPVTNIPTLPGDDFDISLDALLRVMPQVVPLYSRQRMYVYAFWSRYSDLWNNWQVFMSKGYSGNVEKSIPHLQSGVNIISTDISNTNVLPDSLFDYMGLPIGSNFLSLFGSDSSSNSACISALKYMQYLRIYRDYFMNKNEWINDRVLLPDDDSRFRLDDDGQLLSAKDNSKKFYFDNPTRSKFNLEYSSNVNSYYFNGFFHDYPDDYFTSALPFTQRGNTPSIRKTMQTDNLSLSFANSEFFHYTSAVHSVDDSHLLYSYYDNLGGINTDTTQPPFFTQIAQNNYDNQRMINQLQKGTINGDSVYFDLTIEDIRKLAIEQLELEQLARTDGSYRQFGLSFFGEPSKASYDFKPLYIGGTYKNLVFTEVLQTSSAQSETDSPLGAYAGHGITGINQGRIGHLHSDDYGNIMILACIMPDTYYFQGLSKFDTDSLQSDMWLPERVKLGMRPIYNKELYYQGDNSNDLGGDNYLWAYQNPFDEYRYMENRIHGKIADSSNLSFFPFTQARQFTTLPNWGRNFSEASNVSKRYLASQTEDAYSVQFSINIRAVRPLPYKAIPAEVIN